MNNKFKFLFIFMVIFLMSGCSASYNLVITSDEKYSETLQVSQDLQYFADNDIVYIYDYINGFETDVIKSYSFSDSDLYHLYAETDINSYDDSINTYRTYTNANNTWEAFSNNSLITNLFNSKTFSVSDGSLNVMVGDYVQNDYISSVDNFTINITAPYRSTNNNATSVRESGNNIIYSWRFSDPSMIDIDIDFDTSTTIEKEVSDNNFLLIVLIIAGVLIAAGAIYLFIRHANQNNNKL